MSNCITTRYDAGVSRHKQEGTAVAITIPTDETKEGNHPGHIEVLENGCKVWAVWYEKYGCYIAIRKLTPRECFRLQGWSDEYYEKAEFVNSNSQLYKQAGNGVTVGVVYDIAKRMEAAYEIQETGDEQERAPSNGV